MRAMDMESSGLPGEIHISAETRAKLGSLFPVRERTVEVVKGQGEVTTYLVNQKDGVIIQGGDGLRGDGLG